MQKDKDIVEVDKDLSKIIGMNIKSYRKSMGFTQSDLAKFLKVSNPMITYYEKGSRDIDMLKLTRIADLFNIEFGDLLEDNKGVITLNAAVAYKKEKLSKSDLNAIAEFRKIVKNYIKLVE